jgi:hypothetical protein
MQSTRGIDQGRSFVGGPNPGDLSNVGMLIPAERTASYSTRYLFRLATVEVPARHRFWVTSIRQLLTIAARVDIYRDVPQGPQADPSFILLERQVITPMWAFPDGNVSWHLRRTPPDARDREPPMTFQQGCDRNPYGREPAQCAVRPSNTAIGPSLYIPPGAGIPPGEPVSNYGHWNDMRDPWYAQPSTTALGLEVLGPCSVILYASVWQTNPDQRPVPDFGLGPEQFVCSMGLEPEDQFWTAFNASARYHRIAGELTGELEPLDDDEKLPECSEPGCRG